MPDKSDQQPVLDALRRVEVWPGRPERVEVMETHAALIFLAGSDVLKIKRSVNLPYLDFTTLEARHRACQREIELNAPHAPDLYHGLVPIRRLADGSIAISGSSGEVVEWAVSMRRFPQEMLLSEMATRGALTAAMIKSLAECVLAYHRSAQREVTASDRTPDIARSVITAISHANWPDVQSTSADLFMLLAHALADTTSIRKERVDAGCIRRCHGDLHLRNIVLWHGEPVLFDALEFDEALATIDTLYDLAFLLMDLDRKGGRALANTLFNHYLWRSGDSLDLAGLAALPLFLGMRACIRAMVALDRAAVSAQNASAHVTHAVATLSCAARYLRPSPPSLIAIGGLSGTGKTTLAAALAPLIGAAPGALHLRTDLERKWLAGVAELDRLPTAAYTDRQTRVTYDRVAERAATALSAGHSVIVDGVFSAQVERAAIEAIATRANVPFRGLWLDAPTHVMKSRVAGRLADASDATIAMVDRQLANAPRVEDWAHIDASGLPDDVTQRARTALRPFDERFA